jgi:hypothetical protein
MMARGDERVLTLHDGQMQRLAEDAFGRRVESALVRGAEGFGQAPEAERAQFVQEAIREARDAGLRTEQGLAAYALALWYLDPGFPANSRYLPGLLRSAVPEARKVHAMNEWVSAWLREPGAAERADAKMRDAFQRTQAWGSKG